MSLDKLQTRMSAGFGLLMIDRAVKEFHAAGCSTAQTNSYSRVLHQEWWIEVHLMQEG